MNSVINTAVHSPTWRLGPQCIRRSVVTDISDSSAALNFKLYTRCEQCEMGVRQGIINVIPEYVPPLNPVITGD